MSRLRAIALCLGDALLLLIMLAFCGAMVILADALLAPIT